MGLKFNNRDLDKQEVNIDDKLMFIKSKCLFI